MPTAVAAAYPFIDVVIDTSSLQPVAQRSTGVIAVVGVSAAGSAPPNVPRVITTLADAVAAFGSASVLTHSLSLALLQSPTPSKIYGVKVGGAGAEADVRAALDSLNAADDVTFVSLAGIVDAVLLLALRQHVEQNSSAGQKRIGVAMVNPVTAKSSTYVNDVVTAYHPSGTGPDLLSPVSRMVVVAARGAMADDGSPADVATAAMAAMAGYAPSISLVLKRVRGFSVPVEQQYSAGEIKALSEAGIIPIIQPSLLVGGGFYFGEGRAFTSDSSQLYVDVVRTLDDIDFRLKAGLIGLVGDARITRAGLTSVKGAVEGILGPLKRSAVIDSFSVSLPLLDVLAIPEGSRTAADQNLITTARSTRTVDLVVTVTYGPAVHRLRVTLQPKF